MRKILKQLALGRQEAAAVGDGEGDLGMFEEVGLTEAPSVRVDSPGIVDHAFNNGSFTNIVDVLRP